MGALHTAGKLGDHPGVDISALVGAPADKVGVPIHMGAEAIPAPIGLTAHISNLGQRHGYDFVVAGLDALKHVVP